MEQWPLYWPLLSRNISQSTCVYCISCDYHISIDSTNNSAHSQSSTTTKYLLCIYNSKRIDFPEKKKKKWVTKWKANGVVKKTVGKNVMVEVETDECYNAIIMYVRSTREFMYFMSTRCSMYSNTDRHHIKHTAIRCKNDLK